MPQLIALYEKALKLHPDLYYATQLTARVHGKTVFPIRSLEELTALLADQPGGRYCKLDGVTLTFEHAREFFPVKFLPIRDETQLLAKLYVAFTAGRRFHLLQAETERFKRGIAGIAEPNSPTGGINGR